MGVMFEEKSDQYDGVWVADVIPHSAADRAGLKTGDRILKVDRRIVKLPQHINQAMKKDPGDLILLEISRDHRIRKFGSLLVTVLSPLICLIEIF